jgi:hypothetical protein
LAVTDENISAIRARLKFGSIDEFIQGYARYISSGGIFIPMTANKLKPRGATIRFQFLLGDGSTALLGEGRVHQVHRPDPAQPGAPVGLLVKFTKLSQSSKRIVDRIVELKQGGDDDSGAEQLATAPQQAPKRNAGAMHGTMLGVPAPHLSEPHDSEASDAEDSAPDGFEEEDGKLATPLDPLAIPAGASGLEEPTKAGPDPASVTPAKPILERKGPPFGEDDIPLADDSPTRQPDPIDPSLGMGSDEGMFDDELDGQSGGEDDDDFFKLAQSYASEEENSNSGEVNLPRDTPEEELGDPFDFDLGDASEEKEDPPLTREVPDASYEEPIEVPEKTFESANPFAQREGTQPALEAASELAAAMSDGGTPVAGQPRLAPPPGIDPNSEGSVMIDLGQYALEPEDQEPAEQPEPEQQEDELEAGAPPTSFQGDGPMPPAGPRKLAQTEGGLQILAYDEFSATNSSGFDALSFADDEGELDSMFDDIFGGGGDMFGEGGDDGGVYDDFFEGRAADAPEEPQEQPEPEIPEEDPLAALDALPDEVPSITDTEQAPVAAAQSTPEPDPAPTPEPAAKPVELVKAPVSDEDDDDLFGGIFTGPPADAPSHVDEGPQQQEPEGEEPSAELSSLLDNLEDDEGDIPDVGSLDLQGPSMAEDEELEPPQDDESLAALLDMARKDLEEGAPQESDDAQAEGGADLLDNLLGGDDLPPPPDVESPFLPLPEPKKQEKKRGLFSKFFGRDD